MNRPRISSLAGLMLVVATLALVFAALSNTSNHNLEMLTHFRVGLLLFATFRARYGKTSNTDWWFGFAAFGWGFIALEAARAWTVAGLTFSRPSPEYFDLFDLAVSLGVRLEQVLPLGRNGGFYHFAQVARDFLGLLAAFGGGLVASLCAARRKARQERAVG